MASELSAERIILAVDTKDEHEAEHLVLVARQAGARYVKMGLLLSAATSWRHCSELAEAHELEWVADAKLHDIPNTSTPTAEIIAGLPHPPFAITMHIPEGDSARWAMQDIQQTVGDVKMLGVTVLTSERRGNDEEVAREVMRRAQAAAAAGLGGVVCSPLEVGLITGDSATNGLFTMIPGIRSAGVDQGDQARVGTPGEAIADGADLLVIGRQITQAPDPAAEFAAVVAEIEGALSF